MKAPLLCLAVTAAGATIGWFCGTSEYGATATIELVPGVQRVLFQGPAGASPPMREAYMQSMSTLVQAPRFVSAAMRSSEWRGGVPAGVELTQTEVRESLSIVVRGDDLIDVSCESANAGLAALTANAIADSFVAANVESDSSGHVLEKKLAKHGARLTVELETRVALLREITSGVGDDAVSALVESRGEMARRVAMLDLEFEFADLGESREVALETAREIHELRDQLEAIRARIECLEVEIASPRVRVISRAEQPTEPVAGNRSTLAALGAMIGLVLGGGGVMALRR